MHLSLTKKFSKILHPKLACKKSETFIYNFERKIYKKPLARNDEKSITFNGQLLFYFGSSQKQS